MRRHYRFGKLKKWAERYGFTLECLTPEDRTFPRRWRIFDLVGNPLTYSPANVMTVIELAGDWATINYSPAKFATRERGLTGLYTRLRPPRDMRQVGVWLSPELGQDGKERVWVTASFYSGISRPVLKSDCTDPVHVAIMLQAYRSDMEPGIFADWLLDHGYVGESIR